MNFIVAVSEDFAIGKDNHLLFSLPKDLAYFKEHTLNKVVIMGDKTYFSLPKRPLPKRTTIVMTFDKNFNEPNVLAVHSLDELKTALKNFDTNDVWVCGGASIYNLLMDYCDTAYITKVEKKVDADTYISNVDDKPNWRIKEKGKVQEENGLKFSFDVYENQDIKEL